jgi:hypothetical protein
MYTMYIDESGHPDLTNIEPHYPIFVECGCIFSQASVTGSLQPKLEVFKTDLFGRSDINLHTADFTRSQNGFEALEDVVERERFYHCLNKMVAGLSFTTIACVIQKHRHVSRYGKHAFDPYEYSLEILVERFCYFLEKKHDAGKLIVESRGGRFDGQLLTAWRRIKRNGTSYVDTAQIARLLDPTMEIRRKTDNIAGLQIADVMASPIGRRQLQKPCLVDYEVVWSKLRRNWLGKIEGHGLVVLPK